MTLQEIMSYKNFIVIGSTDNPEKYAYKIKDKLIKNGYNVHCVNKENPINNIKEEIDIIDLCINPKLGLDILKSYSGLLKIKGVLIQPGAESEEIKEFLKENKVDYLEGCALVGISLYK